ncbi:MAG: DNA-binding response regulator [Bacteroidetes bacterium GWE2_29_8]|nr:MAG: DNA-binding response regulator [Bacteroidetes bacterium GWE2_29_8]OFY20361.1 MAG: DNA-binding response regulator [Bacteroidetes bacterium GWF2_29_10]
MKCIAIDDEPLALNVIKDFCSKVAYIDLVDVCTNSVDAIKILNEQKIDCVFLDIQMPNMTGIEWISTLTKPPLVIFTTAYREYALQGFDLNAVDYLVKPIPFERFMKATNKAYEIIQYRQKNESELTFSNYMMVKVEYSTVKVNLDDILYIEGLKDYIKIHTLAKLLLTKSTMKRIEAKLPIDKFIRVHKSFIIPIGKIKKIERNRVVIGENWIPIGEQYKNSFAEVMNRIML